MGETGRDYNITQDGKFYYYDLSGKMIFTDDIPNEPDYWREYSKCDKRAEKIIQRIPYSEYAWDIVEDKCKKEYFDCPDGQINYLSKVLDKYKSVIKELNAEIRKQRSIFDKINEERKKLNETTYAKRISKSLGLRDRIFVDYEEINRIIEKYRKNINQDESYVFRKNGDMCEITYNGQTNYIGYTKGMGIIQYLLMRPFEKIKSSDLLEYIGGKILLLSDKEKEENERVRVKRDYDYALNKIYEKNEELFRYLKNKINSGKLWKYSPDADNPIKWLVE